MKTKIFLLSVFVLIATVAMFFVFIAGAHIVKWLIDTRLVFIFCPAVFVGLCAWDSLKEKRGGHVRLNNKIRNNSKNVA